MRLLIGGAKYINLNNPEFQQIWWDAREEQDKFNPVLLIRIAKCSPGAFNRNSRFLYRLLKIAEIEGKYGLPIFY